MVAQQFHFAAIRLNRAGDEPISAQLYQIVRDAILEGSLGAGQKVPSTRELAELLSVSRSTVKASYGQLIAEGYLQSKASASTFVSAELPQPKPARTQRPQFLEPADLAALSPYGRALANTKLTQVPNPAPAEISFFSWRPALDEVPLEQWTRILWRKTRETDRALLDLPASRLGSDRLRAAVARYVKQRDIECDPDQVFIVNGFHQAFDLVCRVHLQSGDSVAIEDPCFPQVHQTIQASGAHLLPISVDSGGFSVEETKAHARSRVKMAYLTPSHQFPTGAIMSLPRRLELLEHAYTHGITIIEDDYDSEFRYSGSPIPALMGLDHHDCVLYIASFSKVIYPSLSLGYLIVPKRFAQIYSNARTLISDAFPIHIQEAVAEFIEEGHLTRHVKRMTQIYDRRRRALVAALQKHLGNKVTIYGDNAGIHLLARIDSNLSDAEIVARAAERGVAIVSTGVYYLKEAPKGEFSFGYGDVTEDQIEIGIKRLAETLR